MKWNLNSGPTNGPWEWVDDGDGRVHLRTPDRGRLVVMDFVRHGMQGARPRFAVMEDDQPRGRRGGILTVLDPWGHPDGRLIAAAPDLLAALREMVSLYDGGTRTVIGASVTAKLLKADTAIAKAEGRS